MHIKYKNKNIKISILKKDILFTSFISVSSKPLKTQSSLELIVPLQSRINSSKTQLNLWRFGRNQESGNKWSTIIECPNLTEIISLMTVDHLWSWITNDHLYYSPCFACWALFGSLVPAMCNRTSCAQVHDTYYW